MRINGQHIEQVSAVNYSSLILDSHSTFEKPFKIVSRVAKANMHTFRLIKHLIFHATNSLCIQSFFFSHLNYCVTSWFQAAATTTELLQINRA